MYFFEDIVKNSTDLPYKDIIMGDLLKYTSS